jgi:membrane protein
VSDADTRPDREIDADTQPDQKVEDPGPGGPTELRKRGWWQVLKRTMKQFQADNLTDWSAALTYYGILSLFPALLVLITSLALLGPSTEKQVIDSVRHLVPGTAGAVIGNMIDNVQHAPKASGILAVVGLLTALWSASGYISAFMRATNAIYDVPEGRPIWKTLPLRLGLTVLTGVLLSASLLAVVMTGRFATLVGRLLHVGGAAVQVWDIAKWPVLVILISLMFAVLYYAAPNVRHGGFRWITPGGLLAVVLWLVASGLFALYVSNFGSYNKTYGTFAGVIVFLIWLWISNIALLLGAEFDAELERQKAIDDGLKPPDKEPYLELRDDRKVKNAERADADLN